LQEVTTGFSADDEEETIFNFLIKPSNTANGAEGMIIACFAFKVKFGRGSVFDSNGHDD
jgi:hypothetical protein